MANSFPDEIGVYDCEINLRFRLIEDKQALVDRDRLLELLLDAFGCGEDAYLEATHVQATATEVDESLASPEMRRQLIRLRNQAC